MKTVTGAQAYASSPALIAVCEALLRYPGKPCGVISFGKGRIEKEPPSTTRERGWDTTASAGKLLRVAADGSAASVNQIATVLHRFGSGPLAGYVRIEPALGSGHENAYDTSTRNIEALEAASRAFILDKYTTLDRTADFLAQP